MKLQIIFNDTIKTVDANFGDNLLQVLLQHGATINTDCGGRGTCGKCKVELIDGKVAGAKIDDNGLVLACKANIETDCTIKVNCNYNKTSNNNVKKEIDNLHHFGIAFDLGTTTLAFALIDIDNKDEIETLSTLNQQKIFGADVISRISASNDGHLLDLHKIIIKQLNDAISFFINKYNIEKIDKVVVSGNTTMLHIFLNVSPMSIGFAPYTPSFIEAKKLEGEILNINADKVILLPSISAFIGADITAGVYATNMNDNSILIDLGTNGEIIYKNKDKYVSTSTAAGPCLEGAEIECGIGGVNGAISKFKSLNGHYEMMTIGNMPACGICGAGLIDIISCLVHDGIIDETGSMNIENNKFNLTENIYLSCQDIRKFQLAKSAIFSGLYTLIKEENKEFDDIDTFYISGGIGYHIDVENAMSVGLLPKCNKNKIIITGNTSLKGAIAVLLDESALNIMNDISHNCSNIDLNHSPVFSSAYIENMFF